MAHLYPATASQSDSTSESSDLSPVPSVNRFHSEHSVDTVMLNSTCFMCNGFYGPSYGEPVCATCHAFLYPDYAVTQVQFEAITEKSDDADSGNDEPAELLYQFGLSGTGSDVSREEPSDSVAQRLELLSVLIPYHHQQPAPNQADQINIESLPPEVLLSIFQYLDEWTLWSVGNVCQQWQNIIKYEVPVERWREMTLRKFPLFRPFLEIDDWFEAYTTLMKSTFCTLCVRQMSLHALPPGEENSWRRNRLRSEMKIMRCDPPDGINAAPLDPPTCCHWQASIAGPAGSPYEGGIFYLYVQVPYTYPMSPPIVRFLTRIYHPNISRHGDIGIDSIHHNWSLALTISKVLISVQSLLTDPNCEICMEPEIGKLYLTNKAAFDEKAQEWTWRYAIHDFSKFSLGSY